MTWTAQKIQKAKQLQKRPGMLLREIAKEIDESYEDVVIVLYGAVAFEAVAQIVNTVVGLDDEDGISSGSARDMIEGQRDFQEADVIDTLSIVEAIDQRVEQVTPPKPDVVAEVAELPVVVAEKTPPRAEKRPSVAPKPAVVAPPAAAPAPVPDLLIPSVQLFRLRNKDKAYLRKNGQSFTYDIAMAWAGTADQVAEVTSRPAFKNYEKVPV